MGTTLRSILQGRFGCDFVGMIGGSWGEGGRKAIVSIKFSHQRWRKTNKQTKIKKIPCSVNTTAR